MKKISIVIPVYNEEEMLNICYETLKEKVMDVLEYDFEIIFINDGSRDKSLEILQNLAKQDVRVKVISFSRNFGSQSAIMAGIKHIDGDATIIMDADLQDPVEALPDMIDLWNQGNDLVYGKRKKRDGETVFKVLSAKLFYSTLNMLSDVEIPKDTGEFRLVDRKIIDVINNLPEHNKFLRGLFSWVGFKQVPYEYERKERVKGETKFTLRKMLRLAKDGIFSFSTKPIESIGKLGLFCILVSFVFLIYILVLYMLQSESLVRGWSSIVFVVTFFSGIQLLSLWIMAQYIERIYDESKNRPNYIIERKINFKE